MVWPNASAQQTAECLGPELREETQDGREDWKGKKERHEGGKMGNRDPGPLRKRGFAVICTEVISEAGGKKCH